MPSAADDGEETVADAQEMRLLRIARLKQQVDAGIYRVPAEEVADAIVRFFSRKISDDDDRLSRWRRR
jgi:anti-sigma28 factor (negative regulator of flagellin synthesis)